MTDEETLIDAIAAGRKVSGPEGCSPRYRAELLRTATTLADSELAGAAGFADCVNLAPTLEARLAASRIVHEKFAHAAAALVVMAPFGVRAEAYVAAHSWSARLDRGVDLGYRRVGGDMRLNVFHSPIQGWLDAVVMNALMGAATAVQLDELTDCSYAPLAETATKIAPVEAAHARLGEAGLKAALAAGADALAAQASVNYWHGRVAATFGRGESERFALYRRYGLRRRANEELLGEWRTRAAALLARHRLAAPG